MKNITRRIYAKIVNLHQFLLYGRKWTQVFFMLLSLASSIGILFIYFEIPRLPFLLEMIVVSAVICMTLLGAVMFRTGAQQVDEVTAMWRSPLHMGSYVIEYVATYQLLQHFQIPVPDILKKELGLEKWSDGMKIAKYVLQKGKDGGALNIVKKFMRGTKDE